MAQELVSVDSDDEDVEYKGDLGIPDVARRLRYWVILSMNKFLRTAN